MILFSRNTEVKIQKQESVKNYRRKNSKSSIPFRPTLPTAAIVLPIDINIKSKLNLILINFFTERAICQFNFSSSQKFFNPVKNICLVFSILSLLHPWFTITFFDITILPLFYFRILFRFVMISEIFLFHLEANYEVDVIYLFSVSIKWFLKFIDKPICGLMKCKKWNEQSNWRKLPRKVKSEKLFFIRENGK